jgi:hypothetical protein
MVDVYFTGIMHFLSIGMALTDMTIAQKKQLVVKSMDYQLIAGKLYKLGKDGILIRCVLEHEIPMILLEVHEGIAGGNYAGKAIVQKILCVGLWWPTLHMDAKKYLHPCDVCQRVENSSIRDEIPLHP